MANDIEYYQKAYKILYTDSPIPKWEEDLSKVMDYLSTLPADAINNLSQYLIENLSVVQECVKRVRVKDANPAMLKMFSVSNVNELVEQLPSLFTPLTLSIWAEALGKIYHGQQVITAHIEFQQEKTKYIYLTWTNTSSSNFENIIVYMVDETAEVEQKLENAKIQQKIVEIQKLESLGLLAGGIAHDMNNYLMVLISNLSLFQINYQGTDEDIRLLDNIEHASFEAANLTKELLAYSGKGNFNMNYFDLNKVITSMRNVLESSVSKFVKLNIESAPNLKKIYIDESQLKQILLNLVINASDAIGQKNGQVTISTCMNKIDRTYLESISINLNELEYYVDQEMVCLKVSDTGSGIPKEKLADIFNPFYSTKAEGRGFGLSVVQGIMKSQGGLITVHSNEGNGASFELLFPASSGEYKDKIPINTKPKVVGPKTVLFCDDERKIRDIGYKILQHMGYTTILAKNGAEAIELTQSMKRDLDLLILDLNTPGKDGIMAYHEIRSFLPNIPIILSSGYDQSVIGKEVLDNKYTDFLQKPYTYHQLREKISFFF